MSLANEHQNDASTSATRVSARAVPTHTAGKADAKAQGSRRRERCGAEGGRNASLLRRGVTSSGGPSQQAPPEPGKGGPHRPPFRGAVPKRRNRGAQGWGAPQRAGSGQEGRHRLRRRLRVRKVPAAQALDSNFRPRRSRQGGPGRGQNSQANGQDEGLSRSTPALKWLSLSLNIATPGPAGDARRLPSICAAADIMTPRRRGSGRPGGCVPRP